MIHSAVLPSHPPCGRGRVGAPRRPQCGASGDLIEVALPGVKFLEEFDRLRKALKAGRVARARVVEANLRLVVSIVKKYLNGPSAIAVKKSDADLDFPRRQVHDLECEVLEVA